MIGTSGIKAWNTYVDDFGLFAEILKKFHGKFEENPTFGAISRKNKSRGGTIRIHTFSVPVEPEIFIKMAPGLQVGVGGLRVPDVNVFTDPGGSRDDAGGGVCRGALRVDPRGCGALRFVDRGRGALRFINGGRGGVCAPYTNPGGPGATRYASNTLRNDPRRWS